MSMWRGSVLHLFVAPEASQAMQARLAVDATAGVGVEGDRYARLRGSYSHRPHPGRQITLFEIETIEALRRDEQIELAPAETRRNVITRGAPLNHLVGQCFTVGGVLLRGDRLSTPCQYLADLLHKPVLKPLLHRAGLSCEVLIGGVIRVGDEVAPAGSPQ